MTKKTAATVPPADTPPSTRYTINLHDTLSSEKYLSNGKEYPFFIVVKNTPFLIVVSSRENPVDFRKTKITACLLYDCEPKKEITLIRSSPLEYVTHLSTNGEEITVEARIHVLTSQQEDSLFRVCVKFNDKELTTEPLKVISKADTTRKAVKDKPSPQNNVDNKRKRTANDFGDVLGRIEKQQREQKELIDTLCKQNAELLEQLQQAKGVPPKTSSPPHRNINRLPGFEEAFASFISSYANLSPHERPQKVRVIKQITSGAQRGLVDGLVKALADDREDTLLSLGYTEEDRGIYEALGTQQPLSPSMFSAEHDDPSIGYWSHLCTPSTSTVCVPSSPNLGDLGGLENDDTVVSDVLDYCLLDL